MYAPLHVNSDTKEKHRALTSDIGHKVIVATTVGETRLTIRWYGEEPAFFEEGGIVQVIAATAGRALRACRTWDISDDHDDDDDDDDDDAFFDL